MQVHIIYCYYNYAQKNYTRVYKYKIRKNIIVQQNLTHKYGNKSIKLYKSTMFGDYHELKFTFQSHLQHKSTEKFTQIYNFT